jgi:hypothetical protein
MLHLTQILAQILAQGVHAFVDPPREAEDQAVRSVGLARNILHHPLFPGPS